MEEIKVNLDNLTNEERETLLKLVEKGNKQIKGRWRSKKGDAYYFISSRGNLIKNTENGYACDEQYRLGNYFKTEEANFAREKQVVYQQLKDYALKHNEEPINWENPKQDKWYIFYDSNIEGCLTNFYTKTVRRVGEIYFSSPEIAKDAVLSVGLNRVKKYLFDMDIKEENI